MPNCEVVADFGNGMVYVSGAAEGVSAQVFQHRWGQVTQRAAHATLLSVPPDWKAGIDVFGQRPAGWEVMRELKLRFDPNGTLNRGRFVGRL